MIRIIWKDIRTIEEIPLIKPDCIEQKRWESIQDLRAEADKKRSLASGYLLDYMCRDLQVANPVYGYTKRGKPVLKDTECSFNISHSGDYVVLAYQPQGEELGVDIQKIRPMREGMERRLLHEKEKMFLPEGEEVRLRYQNRLWNVKESFVKMTGEGLLRDLRTIRVDFENDTAISDEGKKAYFTVWNWKDDYYLSICGTNDKEIEMKEI